MHGSNSDGSNTDGLYRARIAVSAKRTTLAKIAAECNVTSLHLKFVLGGKRRPSKRLMTAMAAAFGSWWAFVCGHVDLVVQPAPAISDDSKVAS